MKNSRNWNGQIQRAKPKVFTFSIFSYDLYLSVWVYSFTSFILIIRCTWHVWHFVWKNCYLKILYLNSPTCWDSSPAARKRSPHIHLRCSSPPITFDPVSSLNLKTTRCIVWIYLASHLDFWGWNVEHVFGLMPSSFILRCLVEPFNNKTS